MKKGGTKMSTHKLNTKQTLYQYRLERLLMPRCFLVVPSIKEFFGEKK